MNIENTGMDVALRNLLDGVSKVIDAKLLLSATETQLRNFVEEYNAKRESMILSKWDELKSRGWNWCEIGRHFVFSKNLIGVHIRQRYGQKCGYQGMCMEFHTNEEYVTCCKKCFEDQKTRCYDEQDDNYNPSQHVYFLVDEYDIVVGPEPKCKPNFRAEILKRWRIPEHARIDSNFLSHEKSVQIGDKKFSLTPIVHDGKPIDYSQLEQASYGL